MVKLDRNHLQLMFVSFTTTCLVIMNAGNVTFASTSLPLAQQLNSYLEQEPILNGAMVGIHIRRAETGEVLYDHLGSTRLTPASNLKLYTAVTALKVLGPDYRFVTEVLMDGPVEKGVLKGNVYIRGGGDPTLQLSNLTHFATVVKNLGIHTVEGDIVGDDRRYDGQRYSIDMPWSDEETYYGAEVSALNLSPDEDFDAGTVRLEVRPGPKVGSHASFTVTPNSSLLSIVNEVRTVENDQKGDLKFSRDHGTNDIHLTGSINLKSDKQVEWVSVGDVTTFTTSLFAEEMQKQGVTITGEAKVGVVPPDAQSVMSHPSITLRELMIPFMKQSNNGHAEVLVKEMGKVVDGRGTFAAGLKVMENILPTYGVDMSQQVIRDGSGISHVNLIRPVDVTSLLVQVKKEPWFPVFYDSLPVSGLKGKRLGGTLKNRLKTEGTKGRIHAKTGTVSTVSGISGYVQTKTQGEYVFSLLINHVLDEDQAKHAEDRLLEILANQ